MTKTGSNRAADETGDFGDFWIMAISSYKNNTKNPPNLQGVFWRQQGTGYRCTFKCFSISSGIQKLRGEASPTLLLGSLFYHLQGDGLRKCLLIIFF
jgi:hypothetical protein